MSLGILSKVYRNTGSYGSPTWTEVTLVSDVTVTPSWDKGDGSVRASRVKQSAKTQMGLEMSVKIRVDLTDAGYLAFLSGLHSDTLLDLMILDGPSTTNGVQGYRADFGVFSGSEDQSMGAVLYRDFSIEPGVSSNPAKSVTVSAGAPVFSNIAA